MRHALHHADQISSDLQGKQLAVLLDYDGTLTPIVRRPEQAVLSETMRERLRQLAQHATVAIVSGRDRQDVERMVAVDTIVYAGSHGFDIQGPGIHLEHAQARQALADLDRAETQLHNALDGIDGAWVERKRFAIAIHYREVSSTDAVHQVEEVVRSVQQQAPSLRMMGGKKIFELQPDVPWNKGKAVLWLVQQLPLQPPQVMVLYIGDDVTDEFAFRALTPHAWGMGIRVGEPDPSSAAAYYVDNCDQVAQLLELMIQHASQTEAES